MFCNNNNNKYRSITRMRFKIKKRKFGKKKEYRKIFKKNIKNSW